MKVAIIVSHLDGYGPVVMINNLINYLKNYDDLNLSLFYLEGIPDSRLTILAQRLDRQKFDFGEYDIIHTNGIRPDFFAFLNRKRIKYHISTIHNFVFDDLRYRYGRLISSVFGRIWLILWKRADKLVCVSNSLKSYYSKWFPALSLEVIYNGINETGNYEPPNPDVIRKIDQLHSNGLKVAGFTGNLSRIKGIDQLIQLVSRIKDIGLVIIGDGDELPDLISLSKKHHMEEKIVFCGYRTNAGIYLKYFDLFIMPSRSEGFGLSLIEAVQQRVPVLCSDITVFRELFTSEQVTFFSPDDPDSFSKGVNTAIESGLGKTARAFERYSESYTASLMAKHYHDIYRSCGNRPVA